MIDVTSTLEGGIAFNLNGQTETIPAHIASALISKMLALMAQQATKTGDDRPEGGAIIYPHAAAVEIHKETGDPRLRLQFGKALLVLEMPPGEMKKIARMIYVK